jgi:serine/threonine protein kinase
MQSPDPFIGRELLGGQFKVVQKIGTGGMGSVYKAEQPAMNRMVAIKILHPKLASRKDLVSRFRREARAMSQLTHPNTVKVFMYGELEEDGSLYIVMELLEGRNLNQTVRKEGPMTPERAVPVLMHVCGALQEAHDIGIVHRDLKPENIFLCRQGGLSDFAKVLDFGLAKVTERQMRPGSMILTQEGMVFGTPEFMSPEQAQGKTLDARSDIYSLAVILYECLCGKLPFDAKVPMEYIQRHVLEPPIPLNRRTTERLFHPGLEAVITRALSKQPDDRYQTALEFAEALRPFAAPGAAAYQPPTVSTQADTVMAISATNPQVTVPSAAPAAIKAGPVAQQSPQRPHPQQTTQPTVPTGPSTPLLAFVALVFLVVGVAITLIVMRLLGR